MISITEGSQPSRPCLLGIWLLLSLVPTTILVHTQAIALLVPVTGGFNMLTDDQGSAQRWRPSRRRAAAANAVGTLGQYGDHLQPDPHFHLGRLRVRARRE